MSDAFIQYLKDKYAKAARIVKQYAQAKRNELKK